MLRRSGDDQRPPSTVNIVPGFPLIKSQESVPHLSQSLNVATARALPPPKLMSLRARNVMLEKYCDPLYINQPRRPSMSTRPSRPTNTAGPS